MIRFLREIGLQQEKLYGKANCYTYNKRAVLVLRAIILWLYKNKPGIF